MALPITERANALSMAIDVAPPQGILSILHSIDMQIFDGWSEVRLPLRRAYHLSSSHRYGKGFPGFPVPARPIR